MDGIDPRVIQTGRAALSRGSSSFAAAAKLLDPATRESVVLLYAWCRHCDDVIDQQELGHGLAGVARPDGDVSVRVQALRRATVAALAGDASVDPVFSGLGHVARKHAIADAFPLELIDGFAMDAAGRQYRTLEDTLSYSYHVAGVVGIMMAQVMGARDPAALRRASDLGIAFQLSNIARDVVDDARSGRVYLPADWLAEADLPADELQLPEHRPAIARVVARLLDTAEPYYDSALTGLGHLTPRNACAIGAARGIYREIGVLVRKRGPLAWDERIRTGTMRKLSLAMAGCALALREHARAGRGEGRPRCGLWTPPALRGA